MYIHLAMTKSPHNGNHQKKLSETEPLLPLKEGRHLGFEGAAKLVEGLGRFFRNAAGNDQSSRNWVAKNSKILEINMGW